MFYLLNIYLHFPQAQGLHTHRHIDIYCYMGQEKDYGFIRIVPAVYIQRGQYNRSQCWTWIWEEWKSQWCNSTVRSFTGLSGSTAEDDGADPAREVRSARQCRWRGLHNTKQQKCGTQPNCPPEMPQRSLTDFYTVKWIHQLPTNISYSISHLIHRLILKCAILCYSKNNPPLCFFNTHNQACTHDLSCCWFPFWSVMTRDMSAPL